MGLLLLALSGAQMSPSLITYTQKRIHKMTLLPPTPGVVTAVSIQCAPKPASVQVAFLKMESFDAVRRVLLLAKRRLGEVLSACEFLDRESIAMATEFLPGASNPLHAESSPTSSSSSSSSSQTDGGPFYMLIETHGSDASHDAAKLEAFLEDAMGGGLVTDGTIAGSDAQAAGIWRVREGVAEALVRRGEGYKGGGGGVSRLRRTTPGVLAAHSDQTPPLHPPPEIKTHPPGGPIFKYDLSIPLPHMYALVEEMRARMAGIPGVRVVGYGHVGDSNLHLNVSAPPPAAAANGGQASGLTSGSSSGSSGKEQRQLAAEVLSRIEPFVYEWTAARGGSISAEHGLGLMKAECVGYSKPAPAVALMGRIKALMDPRGILNPYKVLPAAVRGGGGE
jgi:D-2-hydroxyglutarate dehydrogenase